MAMISDNINNERFFDELEELLKVYGIDKQADTASHLLSQFIGQSLDAIESLCSNRDRGNGQKEYGN